MKTKGSDEFLDWAKKQKENYILQIDGVSIPPIILHTDKILADPNRKPKSGDVCMVCFKDGRRDIKLFFNKGNDEIVLKTEEKEFKGETYPLSQVALVHPIIRIFRDLSGDPDWFQGRCMWFDPITKAQKIVNKR